MDEENSTQAAKISESAEKIPQTNGKNIVLIVGIIAIIAIVIIIAASRLFYFSSGKHIAQQTPQSTTHQTTSTSKTNLNPNTGSLYGDIKVRLNEVLK